MKVSKKERETQYTSSKGSQLRWRKNDLFIKKDSLGYEGFAEELVSMLLNCTNIPHVEYTQCDIWEDGEYIGRGCYSKNMISDGELLIPFGSILKKYSSNYLSFTYDETREAIYDLTGLDCINYLDTCICLDAIIRNEDRHFNNFALILDRNGKYRFAPLFDHGLSLLSDIISYPYSKDLYANWKSVYSKPFRTTFSRQLELVHNPIEIDISKLPKFTGRAYEALLLGLRETEGIAWKHANLK